MHYYSAKQAGFFHASVHSTLPDDAKPVEEKEYVRLLSAQSEGKRIVADASGNPTLSDEQPVIEVTEESVRSKRDNLLNESDRYMLPDYPISDNGKQLWVDYRQALRDIPNQPGFPQEVNWPETPNVS